MTDLDQLTVRRFTADQRADFFELHSDANQAGLCACVAWWVPTWQGWGERTAAQNRALREQLCAQGEYDGYLLYKAERPVGWCQAGPRDRLAKLAAQFALAPDPDAWALSCFLIAPAYRRQGLAARLLAGVLADLRARGVRRVEAFPRRGAGQPDDDAWTGPESLFRAAGFTLEREMGPRALLAIDLFD